MQMFPHVKEKADEQGLMIGLRMRESNRNKDQADTGGIVVDRRGGQILNLSRLCNSVGMGMF